MSKKWKVVLILSLIGNLLIVYVAYKAIEYRTHINHFLDKYNRVVEEFSSRAVFADDNLSLRSDTTVPGRLVFFGTQVAAGWDLAAFFPGFETINRGVAGQRAAGLVLRFRPDVIDLKPEAVIIEISSYNLRPTSGLPEIEDYATDLADLAGANGIRPLMMTLIPPGRDIDRSEYEEYALIDSIKVYNDWLRDFCRGRGYACVDINRLLADPDGYLREECAFTTVEPNRAGYRLISEAIMNYLKSDRADTKAAPK